MKCPICAEECKFQDKLWFCEACDRSYIPTVREVKPPSPQAIKKAKARRVRRLKEGGMSEEEIRKLMEKENE